MAGVSAEVAAANEAELARGMVNLNAMLKAAKIGTREALLKIGIEVVAEVKVELSKPGSGAMYYVRHAASGSTYMSRTPPGIAHQASAPGEPPAPNTGKYRGSWAWRDGQDSFGPYVDVFTSDKRGPWFEYGTRHMAPRPHLRTVIAREVERLQAQFVEAIVAEQMRALSGLKVSRV